MIAGLDWWFWVTAVLGSLSAAAALVQYVRGYAPDDYSQGPVLLLEAYLVVYLIGSIIMQAVGPGPRGDWLEYYGYLLTAMVIPAGAFFYSLSERTRWLRFCWRFLARC